MIQQWKKRVDVMRFIFTLLSDKQFNTKSALELLTKENFDAQSCQIIEYFINNKNEIVDKISKLLKNNWTWDRISIINQAILAESYSEQKILKTPRKIIIDQAVVNAKKYSDLGMYKFINGVLDNLLEKDDNE